MPIGCRFEQKQTHKVCSKSLHLLMNTDAKMEMSFNCKTHCLQNKKKTRFSSMSIVVMVNCICLSKQIIFDLLRGLLEAFVVSTPVYCNACIAILNEPSVMISKLTCCHS